MTGNDVRTAFRVDDSMTACPGARMTPHKEIVMRPMVRSLAFPALVGSLVFLTGVSGERQGVVAQEQKVPTVTRMFTGTDGLTHLEPVDMPVSQLIKVAAVQFNRSSAARPNARTIDFHNAPHRRYVVTLSGAAEIVVSGDNNMKFIADRDHILLAEDVTGKGHTTRPVGPEDWVTLFVEVNPAPRPTN
jgi:hypothetical protein